MNWLAENALAIVILGAIALTMALIVYTQTRSNGSLFAVVGVVLVTLALLVANRLIETPREAVERTLYSLAETIEADDVEGALAYLAPTADAELRKDVQTLMPQVKIELARVVGTPETTMNPDGETALVTCRGLVQAIDRRDGMKGAVEDRLTLMWVRDGDRWLLENYASEKNLSRARGNRRGFTGLSTP
jgi:hypothetical protein